MSRFDYVKYDEKSIKIQEWMKHEFQLLEKVIHQDLVSPRAKALILTKLEETYMWVGKAIRDDQIDRNNSTESQEERNNS